MEMPRPVPGVGAAVGGLTGALVGLGIPEYEAKRYEGKNQSGQYAYFSAFGK